MVYKNISHFKFMLEALKQANFAIKAGDVPVGAILVKDGALVSKAHNLTVTNKDPSAHAEMLVLRAAARRLKNERLTGTILYTTLEPCVMCAGAIIQARVSMVVYGAKDPKAGACGSVFKIHKTKKLNHRFRVIGGVLAEESSKLLKDFFKAKRKK